eukprot:11220836-Lingulodinium_polyedra.AAC.1
MASKASKNCASSKGEKDADGPRLAARTQEFRGALATDNQSALGSQRRSPPASDSGAPGQAPSGRGAGSC